MARQATVLVADDILYTLTGKAVLNGVYSADILIAHDSIIAPQLIFYFCIETDVSEPFQSVTVQVILPGNDPVTNVIPFQWPAPVPPDRMKFFIRWPLLIQNATLRSGRIVAKVIHEKGELLASAPWIVKLPPSDPSAKPN